MNIYVINVIAGLKVTWEHYPTSIKQTIQWKKNRFRYIFNV